MAARFLIEPDSASAEPLRALASPSRRGSGPERRRDLSSPAPGRSEGRSTISANYALVAAHVQRPVLLVDADMRSPSLHEMFDLPLSAGTRRCASRSPGSVASHPHVSVARRSPRDDGRIATAAPRRRSGFAGDGGATREGLRGMRGGRARLSARAQRPPMRLASRHIDRTEVVMVLNRSGKRRQVVSALRRLAVTEASVLGLVVNREGTLSGRSLAQSSCSTKLSVAPSQWALVAGLVAANVGLGAMLARARTEGRGARRPPGDRGGDRSLIASNRAILVFAAFALSALRAGHPYRRPSRSRAGSRCTRRTFSWSWRSHRGWRPGLMNREEARPSSLRTRGFSDGRCCFSGSRWSRPSSGATNGMARSWSAFRCAFSSMPASPPPLPISSPAMLTGGLSGSSMRERSGRRGVAVYGYATGTVSGQWSGTCRREESASLPVARRCSWPGRSCSRFSTSNSTAQQDGRPASGDGGPRNVCSREHRCQRTTFAAVGVLVPLLSPWHFRHVGLRAAEFSCHLVRPVPRARGPSPPERQPEPLPDASRTQSRRARHRRDRAAGA